MELAFTVINFHRSLDLPLNHDGGYDEAPVIQAVNKS